jgi:hypothetical protein
LTELYLEITMKLKITFLADEEAILFNSWYCLCLLNQQKPRYEFLQQCKTCLFWQWWNQTLP